MRRCFEFGVPGLFLFLFMAADQPAEKPLSNGISPYEHAVRNALDRAQGNLERATDLWEDHSTWETAWQVRSGPFIVKTTHSWRLGRGIGQRLEMMLDEFKLILKPDFVVNEPLPVYIFPALSQYNQFGNEYGEHHSSIYGSFYAPSHEARPVAALFDENEALTVMFTVHSAVHQLLDRAFSQAPPAWISEGLACYFAFRWTYAWGVSQLQELIAHRRFVSLEEILETPIDQYGGVAGVYFTELGMLFYYLLSFREDTWITEEEDGAFATYLRAVLRGADTSQMSFHDLVTQRLGQLEADFKAFAFPPQ